MVKENKKTEKLEEPEKQPVQENQPGNEKGPDVEKKLEEYKELLQRLQAEFENYRKRCERESAEQREYANRELIAAFLPVLDSFDLALKNTENRELFVEGVKSIYAQFYSILEGFGVKRIGAVGRDFDPYLHEALLLDESGEDGKVVDELQRGYMLKEAVIRHSKVKVGRRKETEVKNG